MHLWTNPRLEILKFDYFECKFFAENERLTIQEEPKDTSKLVAASVSYTESQSKLDR